MRSARLGSGFLPAVLFAGLIGCGSESDEKYTVYFQPKGIVTAAREPEVCSECTKIGGEGHICGVTTFCNVCRRDAGPGHVHGVTTFDPDCEIEVGVRHRHGVTHFCKACQEEIASNHFVDGAGHCWTQFDPVCGYDVGPDHRHGVTHWCPRCRVEVGEGHVCGLTAFCSDCEKEGGSGGMCPEDLTELGGSEVVGTVVDCPSCGRTVTAVAHHCPFTSFCTICRREQPAGHGHDK